MISAGSGISGSDLVESKPSLRKVRIDVEGSMVLYYWKQRICTRFKEGCDKSSKLVEFVIPCYMICDKYSDHLYGVFSV